MLLEKGITSLNDLEIKMLESIPGWIKLCNLLTQIISLEEKLCLKPKSKPCEKQLSIEWFGELKCSDNKLDGQKLIVCRIFLKALYKGTSR